MKARSNESSVSKEGTGWFAGVKAAPPIEVSITLYLLIKNDSMFIEQKVSAFLLVPREG